MNEKELEKAKKTLGLSSTIKNLYENKIKEILIASNYPKEEEEKLRDLSKAHDVPIKKLEFDNIKLGIICKKTFNVSVLGIIKEE